VGRIFGFWRRYCYSNALAIFDAHKIFPTDKKKHGCFLFIRVPLHLWGDIGEVLLFAGLSLVTLRANEVRNLDFRREISRKNRSK
jgi:hypothetical protein